jgi:hypothetical protein
MASFHENVMEYKKRLREGVIKEAYRGLMEYIMALRTHFSVRHPDCFISGGVYYGYMDMTYFAFSPETLKRRNLKIAVVFIHDACRFEVWLAGYNKRAQSKYWNLFKQSGWDKYRLVPTTKGADAIIENVAVEHPNFDDLDALTKQIERAALKFIGDVEEFLGKNDR